MLYPSFRLCCPARSPASSGPAARKKRGFNLIEAAVVLLVVGLVIGGIWYAAASVQQSQRINNTAAGIIQIAQGARRLFSHNDYPIVASTNVDVSATAAAGGLLPSDFKFLSGFITSPMGAKIWLRLSCWGAPLSSSCPMFNVSLYTPSSSDCVQLIRRFAGLAKDNSDFLYVQRGSTSSGSLFLYPPINPALVTCPADTTYLQFWFEP